MRILVTGGAGFIGSHLVDRLLQAGHRVIIIDNLSTGNIENVNPQAVFYLLDIREQAIEEVFRWERPEVVLHHAAQVSVQESFANPLYDASTNVIGSLNVFENCVRYGVQKVIYASSAAVYGEPCYLGIDEAHPIAPLSCYGLSKYTPELYLQVLNATYGLRFTVLRYANVYGPRQVANGEEGVVAVFFTKLMHGEAPVIFGDGQQTRDFIFVGDVVAANLQALKRGDGAVINIGTNSRISVNELYQMVQALMPKRVAPRYAAKREGDLLHSFLDNTKAKQLLDWEPVWTLPEGLRETFAYYRQH